jgi:hypothetical protein
VALLDGVWWLVNPSGEPEVTLGVNHIQPLLMLGPYNRAATLERYGADFVVPGSVGTRPVVENAGFERASDFNPNGSAARKWVSQIRADFADWGFSALGYHTDLPRPLFRDGLAYIQPVAAVRLEPYSHRYGLELEYLAGVY